MDSSPGLVALARLPAARRRELLNPEADGAGDGLDPLAAVSRFRRDHPELPEHLSSAVIGQRSLIRVGSERGLIPGDGTWLTTPVGLEQSSRPEVATRRASMVASLGVRSVVDCTAGIGIDAAAFAEGGMSVTAIERDPVTAAVCAANVEGTTLPASLQARVVCSDATESDVVVQAATGMPSPVAVFVDPSRRGQARPIDGSRARPERDPELWSPPWSFVESLRDTFDVVAAKAPGSFTPAPHWSCEWIGVADSVVECAVYSHTPDSFSSTRQATLLGDSAREPLTYPVDGREAPIGSLQEFLGEPHPVFRRSIAALCERGAHAVHQHSSWITSTDSQIEGVRWYRLLAKAPLKTIGATAKAHGIAAVAIKSKESRQPLDSIRKRIGLPDGDQHAVIVAAGVDQALLVERIR